MKDKHDFNHDLPDAEGDRQLDQVLQSYGTDLETVKFAMSIADRLQSGEISEEMVNAGYLLGTHAFYAEIFKAMAAELIKECSE